MIVTHFLQKAYRKITEKPTTDKEETYRAMRDAYGQWLREHKLDSISTPREGTKIMAKDPSAALSSIAQANLDLMESLAR